MSQRKRYKKKPEEFVVAVQLQLDTDGFTYHKWSAEQYCKQGDWLVNNNGDVYTVDKDVFVRTYKQLSPGIYLKTTPVWAEIAQQPGSVKTKEGLSHFKSGDYLVYNNQDGSDAYCMSAEKFDKMYELDD